ncbi:MAG: hypothetical protein ABSH36_07525, partial [Solirubrobacteraceae bacterium]
MALGAPEAPAPVTVEAVTATSATFQGELNPGKSGPAGSYELDTYEFLYNTGGSCEGGGKAPEPAGMSLGGGQEALPLVAVSGLRPDSEYAVCLLARNGAGETAVGSPTMFTTSTAPPTIASESVTNVEAAAATLEAEIDPDGVATTYHFEYGTSDAYGQSTPESASIGEGNLDRTVTARITSLEPGTTYHYRVVASSSLSPGGTLGPDKTLITPVAPGSEPVQSCSNEQRRAEQPYGLELPDCRAYELVSPVETNGSDATDPNTGSVLGTVNVSRAAVSGEALAFDSLGSFADPAGAWLNNQFVSRRGPGGWATESITPPTAAYQLNPGIPDEVLDFTPELTEAVVRTDVPLVGGVPAGQQELYLADLTDGTYQWVSSEPASDQLPYLNGPQQWALPRGTSTDLSHVAFDEVGEQPGDGLYEWVDGRVVTVAGRGDAGMGAFSGSEEYARDSWNAVSSDGSRVYFTEPPSSAKPERELRIRENADQEQSKVEGGRCVEPVKACTVLVGGEYWTATPDGRYAYSTEGEALWRFNVEGEAGHEREEIAGGVVGVIGINETGEDGAYVYFVSKSALTAPANGEGEEPAVGQPNVYLDHDGQLTFIARLAAGDETDWGRVGGIRNGLKLDTAVVSLDGTHLAFVSERSLTGYDNRQAEPGECEQSGASSGEGGINETGSCREVYLYDAATGGLVCASCDPSGARPVGPSSLGEKEGSEDVEYQRRNLSADGSRLFFESFDALLPHDSDGRQNVFEYEDGHVYPVSDVAGDSNSYFLDASASGSDVFIATADQLLARGSSDRIAVYDARVGGG